MKWEDIEKANAEMYKLPIDLKNKDGTITTKDYAMVNDRLLAFRKVMPDAGIDFAITHYDSKEVIVRCEIRDKDGRLIGCGHAQEEKDKGYINKTSFVENCETSALGRALGSLGFGIDESYASAQEVVNAMLNQGGNERTITEQEASVLRDMLVDLGRDVDKFKAKFGVQELEELTARQHAKALKELNEIKKLQEAQQ